MLLSLRNENEIKNTECIFIISRHNKTYENMRLTYELGLYNMKYGKENKNNIDNHCHCGIAVSSSRNWLCYGITTL